MDAELGRDLAERPPLEAVVAGRPVRVVQDEGLERAPGPVHDLRRVDRLDASSPLAVGGLGQLRSDALAGRELAELEDLIPGVVVEEPKLDPGAEAERLAVDLEPGGGGLVEPAKDAAVVFRHGVEGRDHVVEHGTSGAPRELLRDLAVLHHGELAERLDHALAPLAENVGQIVRLLDRHGVGRHRRAVEVYVAVHPLQVGEAESDRSVVHRLVQELPHSCALGGGRRARLRGVDPHHEHHERVQRQIARQVDPLRLSPQALHPLGIGDPVPGQRLAHGGVRDLLGVHHHLHVALAELRRAGSEPEAAVADRDARHPVPRRGGAVGIPVNLRVVVSVRIDDPRRDDPPAGVDHPIRVLSFNRADLGDAPVADGEVGREARSAGAVDHRAVFDHDRVCSHLAELDQRPDGCQ